jgi:LysR family transcriptional regulator, chromosome initiation inhibitor
MLDYASLAAVATIVREGSFERAARALNVTPSAISQRVKQLEDRLGCVLIVRGQPCTATETGRRLCRHVEQVGMLEQDLRTALPRVAPSGKDDGRVTLRVAVNADSLGTWFIAAMTAFLEGDRALLDIALDDQEHTLDWLRSGEVQAAVTANSRPVQGCDSIALGKMRYVAVASPEFVQRYFPRGVTAPALAEAPSLNFDRKDRLQARWIRGACRRDVDVPVHWLPSIQAFVDAGLAGIGWGVNPLLLVQTQLRNGTLIELAPERSMAVPLFWQHTRLQMPMLARLTRAVVSTARSKLRLTV